MKVTRRGFLLSIVAAIGIKQSNLHVSRTGARLIGVTTAPSGLWLGLFQFSDGSTEVIRSENGIDWPKCSELYEEFGPEYTMYNESLKQSGI